MILTKYLIGIVIYGWIFMSIYTVKQGYQKLSDSLI